jgi:hypothetical protein
MFVYLLNIAAQHHVLRFGVHTVRLADEGAPSTSFGIFIIKFKLLLYEIIAAQSQDVVDRQLVLFNDC